MNPLRPDYIGHLTQDDWQQPVGDLRITVNEGGLGMTITVCAAATRIWMNGHELWWSHS